jgi:hypothetical protein
MTSTLIAQDNKQHLQVCSTQARLAMLDGAKTTTVSWQLSSGHLVCPSSATTCREVATIYAF